jgi:glyoxylase-like metal-dependent hydrolase (beta-lactamase superfamily II)
MLEKITDRVFYMPCSEQTDRPALGLICGDKYSLIVDAGNSPKHAKEFLAELNSMSIPPVKYLVITHWHWDHVFGIKDMNLITIAHEKTKEKLEEMKRYKWDDTSLDKYVKEGIYNDFTINCIKEEIQDRENFTLGDLDITYKNNIEIDLGGLSCIIKAVGGTHTEDSSVIYVPKERVIFLGDCVYGTRYNGEYGYTQEKLLPLIDEIEKFEADHFIISHQKLYNKKEINEFWSQLRNTGKIVGTGTSSEDATKRFLEIYNRMPSEDEASYIECFANVNKAIKQ